ncbi:heterokaryon incompatibility protein-domain-containing protein [Xylariales sp. AK1849]|nr:heterokaryon incompatibility protein-domain-containing protein [Xylariales sp. AK1849]
MMICDFCRDNILDSRISKTWGFHHRSPLGLEASALEGCVFCRSLINHLREDGSSLLESWYSRADIGDAVYRWSMRRVPSMGEKQKYISVTFRSLPAKKGDGGDSTKYYLSDETFYLLPESNLLALPLPNQLGFSTSSSQSWAQIDRWLTACIGGHTDCKRHDCNPGFRPSRLLDIGPNTAKWPPPFVRLNCAEDAHSGGGRGLSYVTLSHSWGPKPSFARLLKGNIKDWTEAGIPWTKVCTNTNFVHALEVTRRLGKRFIWIDSLCIIQGDALDWASEAPKMQDVYRNSYCNIAAADSSDQHSGLFRSRSPHRVASAHYQGEERKSNVLLAGERWRIVAGNLWHDLLHDPLYTRGWVFQERMLAPRILHFSKEQVFWDCASLSACEAIPTGLPQQLDDAASVDRQWRGWLRAPKDSKQMNVDAFWSKAVRIYTSNDLTKKSDKLQAIWGIASVVAEAQKEVWGAWGAGLWATYLENQLVWTVSKKEDTSSVKTKQERNSELPSWSWASVDGIVELAEIWSSGAFYTVQNHQGGPIFFQKGAKFEAYGLTEPAIEMRCHVGEAMVRLDQSKRFTLELESPCGGQNPVQVFPDTPLDAERKSKFMILTVHKEPKRLMTADGRLIASVFVQDDESIEFGYSGFGLLVDEERDQPNFYKRTGVVKFSGLSSSQWRYVRSLCGDFNDDKATELNPTSESAKEIWLG